MIPESFIQDLLARVDIVELIDACVPLKKAGANYAACCPFHSEKTPSFTVSPSKQFYHCFGCGAHGTAIGFLMEYSGLGFVEAVKELAQKAGMRLPEQSGAPTPAEPRRPDMHAVLSAASRYYREQLKHSQRGIEYLRGRGLTGETAARFGIGYAPDGWQNLADAFPDYGLEVLQAAGLVIRNEGGRLYDRFRDRIMFPILSAKGEVIAFGGRVLGKEEPKYLNSPETPLFEKGRELFGLPQARQALRERNLAIVVEGYMDVVALSQYGVGNALATLGTATTPEHVRKLFRLVDRVVFCFDGDNAGRKAAWRALENTLDALNDGKQIAFAFLPDGEDPDSFVRGSGAAAFQEFVDRASPLSEYLVRELSARSDPGTAEGRSGMLHLAKPLLARIVSPAYRLQLIKRLGELSQTTPGEIESLCGLKPVSAPHRGRRLVRTAPSLSRTIARLLLRKPELAAQFGVDELPPGADGDMLKTIVSICREPEAPRSTAALLERLRGRLDPRLLETVSAEVIAHLLDDGDCQAEFDDAISRLREEQRKALVRRLTEKERSTGLSTDEKRKLLDLLTSSRPNGPTIG